jgi:hypothetical protein
VVVVPERARVSTDCVGTDCTGRWEPGEHLDTGTRARVGMNAARDGWESAQLHRVWDSKPMERHYQMHQN